MQFFRMTNFQCAQRICLIAMCAVLAANTARASRPRDPLPPPEFTLDADSPSMIGGDLRPSDILIPGGTAPVVLVSGITLGLVSPTDDLNALSGPNPGLEPADMYALLFSVDRETTGAVGPDPQFVAEHVPYNVLDQWSRGQSAGDMYMSSELFNRTTTSGRPSGNNVLIRNNYDEGGTNYSSQPPSHARDDVSGASQDNVNGSSQLSGGARAIVENVYFCAAAQSPSLSELSLPFPPSGAHVFFNLEPRGRGTPTTIFATCFDVGLALGDDIDALTVFDSNLNGVFDGTDALLFSLTPDSESLSKLQATAADVFLFQVGDAAPTILATPEMIGLGADADNVDALNFVLCMDPGVCGSAFGIVALPGDWNDDGYVNVVDFSQLTLTITGPGNSYVDGFQWFDLDDDLDIDMQDLGGFQREFTGGAPPISDALR